jgi:glycosyltransferase involved in cell wall biosynthesis
MLRDKGIVEFCEAAKMLRKRFPDTRFRLLGPIDHDNPNGIDPGELEELVSSAGVEYIGAVHDVRPVLSTASVFVLPSYYREGTPRAILEAMASGLPVVTTDHPGCRETVDPGVNGILVVPRDSESLYEAMLALRSDPELVKCMGIEARRIAETRYNVHGVNDSILRAMGEAV